MPDLNRGLAERVEVFTRATSAALQKSVSEVLDARNPWQLLYRLSRIVLLGLVVYTAWLLITLQPDLAKRMSSTPAESLQQQVSAHQSQVQALLRSAIESAGDGLHTLALLQWDGGSSVTVLAAEGRHGPLGLSPGQQPLLGIEMAEALGHIALGLCIHERPEALPFTARASGGGSAMALLCPVGCSGLEAGHGLLLGIYAEARSETAAPPQQRQQKQLQLIARRLGELLAGP